MTPFIILFIFCLIRIIYFSHDSKLFPLNKSKINISRDFMCDVDQKYENGLNQDFWIDLQ